MAAGSVLRLGVLFDNAKANKAIDDTDSRLMRLQKTSKGSMGADGLDAVTRSAQMAAAATGAVTKQFRDALASVAAFGAGFTQYVTIPIALFLQQAFSQSQQLDSFRKGLTSLIGDAYLAGQKLVELRTLALNPGLDFTSVAGGYRRLLAAGLDSKLSTNAVKEFGNALALVGGTSDDLNGVNLALAQIASKSKVSAEEINQLAERIPQIRRLMISAYGTADTEVLQKQNVQPIDFIRRLVEEAAKLPRATNDIRNEVKNTADSIRQALSIIGDDLARILLPIMKQVSISVKEAAEAFRQLPEGTRQTILVLTLIVAALGPLLASLNLVKLAIDLVVSGFGLLKAVFGGTAATQVAQTAATNAQAVAMERLAAASTRAAAAQGAEGVYAGVETVGRTAGLARTMDAGADIVAAKEAARAKLIQRKLTQEKAGLFAYTAVSGASFGTAASRQTAGMIEKESARIAQFTGMLNAMEVRMAGAAKGAQVVAAELGTVATGFSSVEVAAAGFISLPLIGVLAGIAKGFSDTIASANSAGGIVEVLKAIGRELKDIAAIAVDPVIGALTPSDSTIAGLKRTRDAYVEFIDTIGEKAKKYVPFIRDVQELIDLGKRRLTAERLLDDALANTQRANRDRDRQQATAAGGFETMGDKIRVREQQIAEDEKITNRRREIARELTRDLQKQIAEAQLAQRVIDEVTKQARERNAERASMVEKEGAAFSQANRNLFDRITGFQLLEAAAKQAAKGEEKFQKVVEGGVTLFRSKVKLDKEEDVFLQQIRGNIKRAQGPAENSRDAVSAVNDIELVRLQQQKDQRLTAIELITTTDVRSKLYAEQQKFAIEKDYLDRSLQIQLRQIELKYSLEEQTEELREKIRFEKDALRARTQLDADKALGDAQVRQYQIVRDEALKTFYSIKDGAGRVFDAMVDDFRSVGDVIKGIIKTAFLAPIREGVATMTASIFTGINPSGQRPAGGGGGIGGFFNSVLFGRNGGGGFGGGMGGGFPVPIATGTAGGAIYSNGVSTLGLPPLLQNFPIGFPGTPSGTPPFVGGGGGVAGVGGAAGQIGGLAGMKASGLGFLTQLGQIGATNKLFQNGVYGAKGGAMLGGGAILAFDGLRRGGFVGLAETTAGGALIGAKFGGPVGALIGGAIGAAAGTVRLFIKGADQKLKEEIKRAYGVDISDRSILKQIMELAKSRFGGNTAVAIQSKDVKELVQLYAASTGQTYRGPATESGTLTAVQSGGQLMASAGVGTYGQNLAINPVSSTLGGVSSLGSANGQPTVVRISLDGPSTQQVLRGEAADVAAQVIVSQPRLVAQANAAASADNFGRKNSAFLSLTPGLLQS